MSEEPSHLAPYLRGAIVMALGLTVGSVMIMSSNSFSTFSPLPLTSPHVYVLATLTGILMAYMYENITHIALSVSASTAVAVGCLGLALALSLRAVGWTVSFDGLLRMMGMQLLTYGFAMLILQVAGVFLVLFIRKR